MSGESRRLCWNKGIVDVGNRMPDALWRPMALCSEMSVRIVGIHGSVIAYKYYQFNGFWEVFRKLIFFLENGREFDLTKGKDM